MRKILILIISTIALAGCAQFSQKEAPSEIPGHLAVQIAVDMISAIHADFPPATTTVELNPSDPMLEESLRAKGYAVTGEGIYPEMSLATHRLDELFLGVLKIGPHYTLSRLYAVANGQLRVLSTSLVQNDE